MSNVIGFPKRTDNDEMFGECPHCHRVDNIWNIGLEHWAVCHRHKTKWHIGRNLFSNWREETEEDWKRNRYRLETYRTVWPYPEWGAK
jgi:hypothetical protein